MTADIQLMELLSNRNPEQMRSLIRELSRKNQRNVRMQEVGDTRDKLVKSIEEHLDLNEACQYFRKLSDAIAIVQEETGLSVHVNVCIDPLHPHKDFQSADMTVALRDKDTGQSRVVTTRRYLDKE